MSPNNNARRRFSPLLLFLVPFLVSALAASALDGLSPDAPLSLEEADSRLNVAERMLQGGVHDRALDLAASVLDAPEASGLGGSPDENREWLKRREKARFAHTRARFGLAADHDELADVANEFVQLFNNRYRLPDPGYNIQSAYWAARAYEEMGDYRDAVEYYSRVGGVNLPPEMEGDAARRTSLSLRHMAEEIPYPGTARDNQRRNVLLNQAIAELDRARLAFPVGSRRKEIELDLVALRMARREEQFVREAASEAEAFINSDPSRDELHARAVLFRGQAAAILGNLQDAVVWFQRVIDDEAPSVEDARAARLGLAFALVEMADPAEPGPRAAMLQRAAAALDFAVAGTISPGPWDAIRIVKARVHLTLGEPTFALQTLAPILEGDRVDANAWHLAGLAELRRGRLREAMGYFYPATRPSTVRHDIRHAAGREAALTATARHDYGMALALNHQASRLLRRDRLFSSLLVNESQAMDIRLRLARFGGLFSQSIYLDWLNNADDDIAVPLETRSSDAAADLGRALGRVLWSGGDPDSGYDLAIAAEALDSWTEDPVSGLELSIAMISHLRKRRPDGVTDGALSSRLGEARHALGLARGQVILDAAEPDEAAIDRTLGDFAAAAASFQEASASGLSARDNFDQGMVNMESGAFLMQLADKWQTGRWASRAQIWRNEARQRIEASLRPFNLAIAVSGSASAAAHRAKWSRGRALELMEEWRGAASDYLSLMNNSELPRAVRANAARRWALCMGKLGENRAALTRLAVFAETDAEAALLAGNLAEESGFADDAYRHYLFAADPESPALPPATPGRTQNAAYHAARLALRSPEDANPFVSSVQVIAHARRLLDHGARTDLKGPWTVPMLTLLGENIMNDPDGWQAAYKLATDVIETRGCPKPVRRAMYLLAAKAQTRSGDYGRALDELDSARDLLDDTQSSRSDAALITLETARIYRDQNRRDDALRAYADVFAIYPDQEEADETARVESAVMLLSDAPVGEREREQARSILTGLRDQVHAERIMRDYGIR